MKIRLAILFITIFIVTGCNSIDNRTEEAALGTFVDALTEGNSEKINEISRLDEEQERELITMVNENNLLGAKAKACDLDEEDTLSYHVICTTTDEQKVFMDIKLNKEKNGFYVYEVDYSTVYDIFFRDDHPELTDELIGAVEEVIDGEIYRLNDEDRNELNFELYKLSQAVLEAYSLNPKTFINYIDLDTYNMMQDEDYTESHLVEITTDEFQHMDMGLGTHTEVKLNEITVGSYYDKLKDSGVIDQPRGMKQYDNYVRHDLDLDPAYFYQVIFEYEFSELDSGETMDVDLTLPVFLSYDGWKTLPSPTFGYNFDAIDFELPNPEIQDDWDDEEPSGVSAIDFATAEEIFKSNCSSCHGSDLSGGVGPDLTYVSSEFSAEEIIDIIFDGRGNMPAQNLTDDEAETITAWLMEYY